MSIVAVDKDYLVATDSGVWAFGMICSKPKLFNCGAGWLAAGVGNATAVEACIRWFVDGAVSADWPLPCAQEDWGEVLFVHRATGEVRSYGARNAHYCTLSAPHTIGQASGAGAVLHEMKHYKRSAALALASVIDAGWCDSVNGPVQHSLQPDLPSPSGRADLPVRFDRRSPGE